MSTEDKTDNINVVEEKDGSVTVDLPDQLADQIDRGSDVNADDPGDVDHPDDSDAVREARRNRRRDSRDPLTAPRRRHYQFMGPTAICDDCLRRRHALGVDAAAQH